MSRINSSVQKDSDCSSSVTCNNEDPGSREPGNLFRITRNIVGPIGPGPSSSHTIAPYLVAKEARSRLGDTPDDILILAYNSFGLAGDGDGHGTVMAILAALLGFDVGDPMIPQAEALAKKLGIKKNVLKVLDPNFDENYFELKIKHGDTRLELSAVSVGGGNYRIVAENITRKAA